MIFTYFMLLSMALFAIGIAGVVASRNFLIMMLSIEIVILVQHAACPFAFLLCIKQWHSGIFDCRYGLLHPQRPWRLSLSTGTWSKGKTSLDVTKLSKLRN